MSTPLISAVLIAKDEEDLLGRCLMSVWPLVDEIIVAVDESTTDRTEAVAHGYGALTFRTPWPDDFALARNTALDHATGRWILSMDPDEELTPWGAHVVADFVQRDGSCGPEQAGRFDGLALWIENRTTQDRVISTKTGVPRLFRHEPLIRWWGCAHEEPRLNGDPQAARWGLAPGIGIVHYGYDPSLTASRAKDARNLRLLTRRVHQDPQDGQAWAYLAGQHQAFGRMQDARTCARKAVATGALRDTMYAPWLWKLARGRTA